MSSSDESPPPGPVVARIERTADNFGSLARYYMPSSDGDHMRVVMDLTEDEVPRQGTGDILAFSFDAGVTCERCGRCRIAKHDE